ncbi:hypothetical protein [Brevibacillus gelatini]
MPRKNADRNLKELFEDERIPEVDLVKSVMDRIYLDKNGKEGFFMKYKVSIAIGLGIVLMGTTGLAAMNAYQLYNKEGKVIYQEKDIAESQAPIKNPDEEIQAFMGKMAEIEDNLPAGTAAALYIKDHNPKKRVVTVSKPFVFQDHAALQQKLGDLVKVQPELLGGYKFRTASVDYLVNRDYKKDELYALANMTDEEYVLKPLSFTDTISSIEITYKNGNDALILKVTPFEDVADNTVYQADLDQTKKEKIIVKQTEALFSEHPNQDGTEKELRWVQKVNRTPFLFIVQTSAKNLSKDSIIKVMESFL